MADASGVMEKFNHEDHVLRSVFLSKEDDQLLREMSASIGISRNQLIRKFLSERVLEWRENPELLKLDLLYIKSPELYEMELLSQGK